MDTGTIPPTPDREYGAPLREQQKGLLRAFTERIRAARPLPTASTERRGTYAMF